MSHLRDAVRRALQDRAFATIAVTTLALGIGANTAIFSVAKAVVLQPLPYGDGERVVLIWNAASTTGMTWLSQQEVFNYRRASRLLASLGAYTETGASLTGDEEPERVRSAVVTSNLFSVLGVQPVLGRGFDAAGDGTTPPQDTVVLGHGLWQRRFGGRADVVGERILVNGTPRTVVGVMPASFRLPLDYRSDRPTELWTPFLLDPAALGQWGNSSYIGVGRLRAGASPSAASAELAAIGRSWIAAGYVQDQGDGRFSRVAIPVRQFLTGSVRRPVAVLLATVGFVLLIALANVAHLQLANAAARRRDLAVRAALGADRRTLLAHVLSESVLLAAAGGLFGLAVAHATIRVTVAMGSASLPRIEDAAIDGGVLAFTAAVSVLAGLAFGLLPALELSRTPLNDLLRESSRGASPGRSHARLRQALVVIQVAVSVILVLGAGLLTRSLIELNRIDLGFDTRNVLTAQVQLPTASYADASAVVRLYRALEERLQQVPGVRSAGAIRILPLSRRIGHWSITIEGRPAKPGENPNGDFQWVTPGYFPAMNIRALRGRVITPADRETSQMVAVINDTMARRYWPGEDALGKRFHLGTANQPWLTIVGIIPTIRHNAVVEEPRAEMYLSYAQLARETGNSARSMTIVMKTDGPPLGFVSHLRDAVRAIDPNLPLSDVRTLDEVAARALAEPRLTTWLLGAFALLALAVAAIGVYGTVSRIAADRTQEIGIRLALGASRGSILRMVLSHAAGMTGAGIAAGVAGSVVLTRFLASLLYGVSANDPLTFVLVPVFLAAVALVASLTPASRASKVDPVRALAR